MHNEKGYSVQYDPTTGGPLETSKKGIMLHQTGGNAKSALQSAKGGTGFHTLIDKNGNITELANSKHVTYHAGASHFSSEKSSNAALFGIEFESVQIDKMGRYEELTKAQITNGAKYIAAKIKEFGITLEDVIGHHEATVYKNSASRKKGNNSLTNEDFLDAKKIASNRHSHGEFAGVSRKSDMSVKVMNQIMTEVKKILNE
jgi:N-acetyl-anhydromuramyl-L-alanine amidase AmpD